MKTKILKTNVLILLYLNLSYLIFAQKNYEIDITVEEKKISSDHLKLGGINFKGDKISINNYYMLINDQPIIPVTGEFHFSRYPNKYWDESIRKMKAGGINIIATYIFWNIHEEQEGIFDWSGDKNLRKFVELCAKNKIKTILRIGPFCHGEIRNGGLPDWLLGRPVIIRSNDPDYLTYVERLYNQIGKQVEGMLFKDGGPVLAIQIENEYQHSAAPWGLTYPDQPLDFTSANRDRAIIKEGVGISNTHNPYAKLGNEHMKILKSLALKAGLEVPIYTATGWGNAAVIENECLPVTAAYAYPTWASNKLSPFYLYTNLQKYPDYAPIRYNAEDYPYFAAEISGGIMINYSRRPTVPANSLDALINRFLGSGANGIGYYMYHGGSTPRGKNTFFSDEAYAYPKISYDFQAPIGEYGQIRPSFNRLKLLHFFLNSYCTELAAMSVVLPDNNSSLEPGNINDLRYSIRKTGNKGFIFMLNFQDHTKNKDIENIQFLLKTKEGKLKIPESNTFTLKSEENAIFPFNFDLNGITLNYATAQPLTKFSRENESYFIFFSIDGIEPEFSLSVEKGVTLENSNCTLEENANRILVKFSSNEPGQLSINKPDGKKVKLLLISRKQALKSWFAEINEKNYLVFSDALILQNDQSLEFYSHSNNEIEFNTYPVIEAKPIANHGTIEKIPGKNDIFLQYKLTLPELIMEPAIIKLSGNKMAITIPSEKPDNVNDIFLNIDYIGDTGMGFLNGKLVSDDFYYGKTWYIGLRKFMDMPGVKQMVFYFRLLYPNAPFYEDFVPELIPDFTNSRKILKINKIEYVPEYKACIQFN